MELFEKTPKEMHIYVPCINEDTISRQWLLECLTARGLKFDTEKDENIFIHLVRDIAPPAQPERKKGRWIDDAPTIEPPTTEWLGNHTPFRCKRCGHYSDTRTLYCAYCGKKANNYERSDYEKKL